MYRPCESHWPSEIARKCPCPCAPQQNAAASTTPHSLAACDSKQTSAAAKPPRATAQNASPSPAGHAPRTCASSYFHAPGSLRRRHAAARYCPYGRSASAYQLPFSKARRQSHPASPSASAKPAREKYPPQFFHPPRSTRARSRQDPKASSDCPPAFASGSEWPRSAREPPPADRLREPLDAHSPPPQRRAAPPEKGAPQTRCLSALPNSAAFPAARFASARNPMSCSSPFRFEIALSLGPANPSPEVSWRTPFCPTILTNANKGLAPPTGH